MNGAAAPYLDMGKAEIDLLQAEGHIRMGNAALAVPLINLTRAANNLRAVTVDGAPANTIGGRDCVPKLPNGNCGSLLDALKYEKRMETAFTGYLLWFTDLRGWGDLASGTVVEWPVPYQEMQARKQPFYNGTRVSTGPSTYGF